MLRKYNVFFNELANASTTDFMQLLAQSQCKEAIIQLVGDDASIEDLGLPDSTILKLKRSGMQTIDKLIMCYDVQWRHIDYYIVISKQLEKYIRNLLALIVSNTSSKNTTETEDSSDSEIIEKGNLNTSLSKVDTQNDSLDTSFSEARISMISNHSSSVSNSADEDRLIAVNIESKLIEYCSSRDVPIDSLHLSMRAFNSLKRARIDMLSQLLNCSLTELQKTPNLGRITIREIQSAILSFCKEIDLPQEDKTHTSEVIPDEAFPERATKKASSFPPEINGAQLFSDTYFQPYIINLFEKLDVQLQESDLTVRSYNALNRAGISTFAMLLKAHLNGMQIIQNLGSRSLNEIQSYIDNTLNSYSDYIKSWLESNAESYYSERIVKQKILALYNDDKAFYGFSFQEYRALFPNEVSDELIRSAVSSLLCSGNLEYVDYRCYRRYPSFLDYIHSIDILKSDVKEVLLMRLNGESLQTIADKKGISRECVRQKEFKALKKIVVSNKMKTFDEDYYMYLYQTYSIPREVWTGELGCSEATYQYLRKDKKKQILEPNIKNILIKTNFKLMEN